MGKKLLREADNLARVNYRRRIWRNIVQAMACIVVFCTTYVMILPALTMEKTSCGLEAHTHSNDCYEKVVSESTVRLSCTYELLDVHVHTSVCHDSEGNLLCGQADFFVHAHNDDCMDETGAILCQLPVISEHEHTEDCYEAAETVATEATESGHFQEDACYTTVRGKLTCQKAETEGHAHDEACYTQGELVCQLTEQEGHTHGEACSEMLLACELTVEPHVHGDSCYRQLICQIQEGEEHTHTEECSGSVLDCDLTEQPHIHTDTCYQSSLVCEIQETEGHAHESSCYESLLTCERSEKEAHAHTDSCYAWNSVLTCGLEEGAAEDAAEPELVCDKQVIRLHTHDDFCYEIYTDENGAEQKRLICARLEVREHVHCEDCFVTSNPDDTLTCTLPENENHTHGVMCYGTWQLVCTQEEHTHDESCAPGETAATTAVIERINVLVPEAEVSLLAFSPEKPVDGGSFKAADGVTDLTWALTQNTMSGEYTLTIEGEGAMPDLTQDAAQPWYQYGRLGTVPTSKKIVLGDGITRIGNSSFSNQCVTGVEDWGGVTSIGKGAFYYNGARGVVNIPSQIVSIEAQGIDCGAVLNEGIQFLGSSAIHAPSYDRHVHIPSTLQSMTGASIYGVESYSVAEGNLNFVAVDGVLYSHDMTVLVDFPQYKNVKEFTVPNTVKEISQGALSGLMYVRKVRIPCSVEVYPDQLFSGCSVLEEVYFEDGTVPYNFGRMFFQVPTISSIRLPENTTFQMTTSSAMLSGYSDCYPNLETLKIPNGVTAMWRLWTYNEGLLKALEEVIYDAENASFGWTFLGPGTYFNLTIGPHVDNLNRLFSGYIGDHALQFRFEGPNRFVVEAGGFEAVPAPFTGLHGLFYVDEQGLVYHCDEDTGEAALIYCQPGIETAVIPATIDPDVETYPEEIKVGREFTVTTVRRDALKWAENLESLTFEKLSQITTLETLALANCPSLTSVNGETTVEGATALFAHAQVGYNQFYNTGLTGASAPGAFEQEMNGSEGLKVAEEGAADLKLTASGELSWVDNGDGTGGYRTLTGQTVTITAAADNTVEGQTKRYRVYFRATGDDIALSIEPGKTEVMNGWAFSHYATEDPYTVYIEFGAPPEGNTAGIPVNCIYPNIVSRGGGLTVWSVVVDPEEPEGTILPSDNTMQISWTTQADDFAVTKTAEATSVIGVVGDGEGGAKPAQNIGWKINFYRETETTSPYGKDHATGVEFRDIVTLPDGMKWRDDVAEAIANGTVKANGMNLYAGDTLIARIAESSSVSSASSGMYLRARKLALENGQYVFSWGISSNKTDAEMGSATVTMTIYADALRVDTSEESGFDPAAMATFTNEVYATVHYTYRKDAKYSVNAETGEIENPQLYSVATRNISGGAPVLKLSHAVTPAANYFGENLKYTIDVYNDGALTWYGETIDGSTVYTLKEKLPDELYITPDHMVEMFRDNPDLVVTISNATLSTGWTTTLGIDGKTEVLLHQGNSDSIQVPEETATITISVSEGVYTVAVEGGESYDGTDLAALLDGIGYAVTNPVQYTCSWPLNEETKVFSLKGGEHNYFYVYATVKDTFQIIENDWQIQYHSGTKVNIRSRASVYSPSNKEIQYANRDVQSTRDTKIEKFVTRDGDSLSGSYAANDGDVLDWCLALSHCGTGNHLNLPLVDDICGSQFLLVPQEGNEALAGLPTHGDYYILTQGSYANVWVGVDDEDQRLMAASVEVKIADEESFVIVDGEEKVFSGIHTQIKWYFPEIESGTYQMTVNYQTLVDHDLTGLTYTIGNLVRLNDREDHHLYDVIWGGGSLLEFDKCIVVSEGNTPAGDALDADNYTAIGAGEAVTYRLELRNSLDTTVVLNGAKLADALPLSTTEMPWTKDVNILNFRVVKAEGISCENLDAWYVGDHYSGLVGTRQYILWPESANITFTEPGSIYLYFTLVYPENSETEDLWDRYTDLAAGGRIHNDFYVYREHTGVAHDLKESGRVLLQKGVYGTYHYATSGDTNLKPSNSRLNFNNRDARRRATAYYVLLYNDANKRLYLNDLFDQLPEGFTFLRFIDNISGLNATSNATSVMITGGTNRLTDMSLEKVSYRSARITADTSDGLRFVISAGTGDNAIRYDQEREQYYLEKGEALEFGYVCDVAAVEETGDRATNMIAMPYTDHLGTGVTVVSKEKLFVTAKGQEEYFSDSNDGRRLLKNGQQMQQNYGLEGADEWLVSDVTMYRGSIVPGVTKYVDSFMEDLNGPKTSYVNQVYHTSIVNWRVRLHNSGTLAMSDYTFTDVVQSPYSFVGDVRYTLYGFDSYEISEHSLISIPRHNPQNTSTLTVRDYIGNKDVVITMNGEEVPCGNGNYIFYVSLSVDKLGNEVLSIRFESLNMGIMEGGYMDITLSSVNDTGNYAYSVYSNQATLIPEQDFTIVGQGSVVRNEQGEKIGAKNAASVTVSNGMVTSSGKAVAELEFPENAACDGGYIVLADADNLFTYTLSVCNDTKHEMTRLVLLDSLPEVGDHNPFDVNTNRNSEFQVSLADGHAISIQIVPADEEPYAPTNYQVQYSTGTDFGGPQSNHWKGEPPEADDPTVWTDNANGARSIRVIIDDPIPTDATVVVKFTARVNGDAQPGATAYNSFGYHYELRDQSYELEAMSPIVGVRVPDIPSLVKRLVDSNGVAIQAPEDAAFTFLVYEGAAIDGEFETAQSLRDAVIQAGRAYHEFEVTVKAGEKASDPLEMAAEEWTWRAGATYTIAELPTDETYGFRRFLNTTATSYTFIHTPELSPEIVCENMLKLWTLRIRKVNQDGEPLAGAVFGLYSADRKDQRTEAAPDVAAQILNDDQTLYLAEVATSDAEGLIEWNNLPEDYYYLVEIKAPDGYNLLEQNGLILNRSSADQNNLDVPVVNKPGYELPKTGGIGTVIYIKWALILMATGIILLYIQTQKRKNYN